MGLSKVQASETRSAFTGEVLSRNSMQAYSPTDPVQSVNTPIKLNISKDRKTGNFYSWIAATTNNGKIAWKITKYNSNKDIFDYDTLFYCLNHAIGFGTADGDMTTDGVTYTQKYDMKDNANRSEIIAKAGWDTSITNKNKLYNQLLWILDHAYIQTYHENYQNSEAYKHLMKNANITVDNSRSAFNLTEDDIDVVQQLAIWHFTNEEDRSLRLNTNTLPALYVNDRQLSSYQGGTDSNGNSSGKIRQNKAGTLYQYFLAKAENVSDSTNYSIEAPTLTLSNTNVQISEMAESSVFYYIVGPFKLTGTNTEDIRAITANINKNYTLLNTSKNAVEDNDFTKVIGGDFYLKIKKSDITDNTNLNIGLTYFYNDRTVTVLSNETPNKTQLVATLDDNPASSNVSINTTINFISVQVVKEWDDNNNQDGLRPGSIRVALYEGSTQKDVQTLSEENEWTYKWEGLPSGKTYTVRELDSNGRPIQNNNQYNDSYTQVTYTVSGNKTTITNKHIPETISKKVVKKWVDNNDQDHIRPTSIKVQLYKTVGEVKEAVEGKVTLNASNNWTKTWNNLPKYENGTRIIYSVEEDEVDQYTVSYSAENYFVVNTITITNAHIPYNPDLALRKYITAINDVEIEKNSDNYRVPQITTSELDNESNTTAIYRHKKDPIAVQKGDIVTYKITVYNEGAAVARASKIVDQLPTGLTLKTTGNVTSTKGNEYTIAYNSTTNKITLTTTGTNNLNAYAKNGELDSDTIVLDCEVTADAARTDTVLTNVAWIAEMINVQNETFDADIDSQTITSPDVNKDNLSEYTRPNEDGYYPGEQDDDDFDRVVIPAKVIENEFSVQLVKVAEDGTTPLAGAQFKVNNGRPILVDVNGTEIDTGMLTENGIIELTYKLEETTAPAGYVSLGTKTITITANVVLNEENDTYELTNVKLKKAVEGITVSEENNIITIKVVNEPVTGKYSVILRKVDENNHLLNGSTFEINGITFTLPTAETIIARDQIIDSEEPIDMIYTLKETGVPEGYTGIEETSIHIKITIERDGDQYKVIRASLVDEENNAISNEDIAVKVENGAIVIVVKNTPVQKTFDLALRKFITAVNEEAINREPVVSTSTIATTGTATYRHNKQPVAVQKGDIVTYTIRVYNEGELDGYVDTITDHLPENLLPIIEGVKGIDTNKYKDEIEFNSSWLWSIIDDHTVATSITSKANTETYAVLTGLEDVTDTKLDAYAEGSLTLDYIDVQIKCLVTDAATNDEYLTNIAEITDAEDINGKHWDGTDSELADVDFSNLSDYKNEEALSSNDNSYVVGQQDDDDFEKLIVKEFDLALKKFIAHLEGEGKAEAYLREPEVDASKLGTEDDNGNIITDATYIVDKTPVIVETNDIITYKIRVYNEGTLAGYANEITDNIPEGLTFLPNSSVNVSYKWEMLDENGNVTDDVTKAVMIRTTYLSDANKNNIIDAVKEINGVKVLSYKEVEVQFKVTATAQKDGDNTIKNVAQISADSDRDIDSNPARDEEYDYTNPENNEDDIDYEPIKLQYFDLALRKFITKVNTTEYNNRYPEVIYGADGSVSYSHSKEPVLVTTNDIVTYTIRVYNEGEKDGFATEITDNLPDGLEFVVDNEINKKYGWKLIDSEGNVTDDVTKAVKFTTDYLKDQLIEGFRIEDGQRILSYQDVQIAFKVVEANTSDRILINIAEISKDSGDDVDSTPDNNEPNEDDLDKEYVKVQYFDLSLLKWVTETRVTYNGKTTVTKTGYTPGNEGIAKVDLVASKMKKTTVKFAYKIRVTNEGELPGYAYEVKDYIPKGLKFVAADNPKWKEIKSGVVVTDQLKDTLLQPGESKEVEIVLTWKNSTTNTGLKTNYAEISDDSADDIDSTPDNYNMKEDDIDDAQVILSIKTAGPTTYIGLIFLSVTILAGGVILIKKYVIK